MKKRELQQKRAALVAEETKRLETAVQDGRGLNEQEQKLSDECQAEITRLDNEIESIELAESKLRQMKTKDETLSRADGKRKEVIDRIAEKKARMAEEGLDPDSFLSVGEMCQAVHRLMTGGGGDPRLVKFAPQGHSEGVGGDGGFLVQTDFSLRLATLAREASVIAQRCTSIPIGENANELVMPYVKDDDRTAGNRFGGVRVFRTAEAGSVTATKAQLERWERKLEKLMAVTFMTDELMADAVAMTAVIEIAYANEFSFVLDDEILNADGAGKCHGITQHPSLVSVAKEAGQLLKTLLPENIVKMWSRCRARNRNRPGTAWFINQDIEPQLFLMSMPIGTGGLPVFMPPNGLSQAPFATLMGRAVVPCEQCATLGTKGDIILADFSDYILIEKGGMQSARSIHVAFLTGEEAFRWTSRVNGQPAAKKAVTPAHGTATLSPFVTLDTRA